MAAGFRTKYSVLFQQVKDEAIDVQHERLSTGRISLKQVSEHFRFGMGHDGTTVVDQVTSTRIKTISDVIQC